MKNNKINLMVKIGVGLALCGVLYGAVTVGNISIGKSKSMSERFIENKIKQNWEIVDTYDSEEYVAYVMKLDGRYEAEFLSIMIPKNGTKPFKHNDMETRYIKRVNTSVTENYSTYINREGNNGVYRAIFALQCGDAVILTESTDIFVDFLDRKLVEVISGKLNREDK
ncbi:MAG: hypothetical protein ACRC7W_05720 [Fusobacteriaceae bacterium]